jgi:hypothetical protein
MGLNERRKIKDLPDTTFPGRVKEIEEICGKAIPYDVDGVELSHEGPLCSFDAFLSKYNLNDPALAELARIVRGADTDRLDMTPQCPGLLAISLGLSQVFADDHEQLQHGFVIYDALYAWLRDARLERHTWNPQRQSLAPRP